MIVGINSYSWVEFIDSELLQIVGSMKAIKECDRSTQASHHRPRHEWWHFVKTTWLKLAQILIIFISVIILTFLLWFVASMPRQ